MFGKTKEMTDQIAEHVAEETSADVVIDDFFGDEAAVEQALRFDALRNRVASVEQQIQSQFTSMAAYAQIAQEQVELVRSEAQHSVERSEQKMTSLIERERADRLNGAGGTGSVDVTARLDALEADVADIREKLQVCLSNQKALADAITELFAQPLPTAAPSAPPAPTPAAPATGFAAPSSEFAETDHDLPAPVPAPAAAPADPQPAPPVTDGPIAALSLD